MRKPKQPQVLDKKKNAHGVPATNYDTASASAKTEPSSTAQKQIFPTQLGGSFMNFTSMSAVADSVTRPRFLSSSRGRRKKSVYAEELQGLRSELSALGMALDLTHSDLSFDTHEKQALAAALKRPLVQNMRARSQYARVLSTLEALEQERRKPSEGVVARTRSLFAR